MGPHRARPRPAKLPPDFAGMLTSGCLGRCCRMYHGDRQPYIINDVEFWAQFGIRRKKYSGTRGVTFFICFILLFF